MMIDGVRIHNHVVMNSNKGSLYTDDGPFSHRTAVKIGKNHGLCTYHEMEFEQQQMFVQMSTISSRVRRRKYPKV